jgi:hypothetical protein
MRALRSNASAPLASVQTGRPRVRRGMALVAAGSALSLGCFIGDGRKCSRKVRNFNRRAGVDDSTVV